MSAASSLLVAVLVRSEVLSVGVLLAISFEYFALAVWRFQYE